MTCGKARLGAVAVAILVSCAAPPANDDRSEASASASAASLVTGTTGNPIGTSESFLGQNGLLSITADGCNSVAFAQVPGQIGDFLGRMITPDGACAAAPGFIPLFKMDFTTNHLTRSVAAFTVPQTISNGVNILSAYDPTIESFAGELWAAFECAGAGLPGSVAACVGPYNPTTGKIDPIRTTTPILGISADPNDAYVYSASVPNLLAFNGRLYLYWTAVKIHKGDNQWVSLTSRGAELSREAIEPRRLWVSGLNGPSASFDPAHNVQVWGLDSDPRSNTTADMQGVFTDGQHVFAAVALGGSGCLSPLDQSDGCYRLAISRTLNPLGEGVFGGGDRLGEQYLLSNPISYPRLYTRPDNSRNIMLELLPPLPGSLHPGPVGMFSFPIPSDAPYFAPQPAPHNSARLQVTFDQLHQRHPGCTPSTAASLDCMSASSRLCRDTYGYGTGFGPVQYLGNQAAIACVSSDVSVAQSKRYDALHAYHSGCTGVGVAQSTACSAAVDNFCRTEGYASGLPIVEATASDAAFSCLRAAGGSSVIVPWSELTSAFPGCTLANSGTPNICLPAADTDCIRRGFVSGFGNKQMDVNNGQLACLAVLPEACPAGLVNCNGTCATACTPEPGPTGVMPPGMALTANQSILSPDRRFQLWYQGDGNLVLYQVNVGALWASTTAGTAPGMAVMQGDGNLVVYDAGGVARWASNTSGHPGSSLALQTDGNLVVYSPSKAPLWASNTCCR